MLFCFVSFNTNKSLTLAPRWLALLPHTKNVLSSIPGSFCVELHTERPFQLLCFLAGCWYSWCEAQSKNHKFITRRSPWGLESTDGTGVIAKRFKLDQENGQTHTKEITEEELEEWFLTYCQVNNSLKSKLWTIFTIGTCSNQIFW